MSYPRMLQDNVLIVLEPRETQTKSGIALVHGANPKARDHRTARVLSVGPGHYTGCRQCGTKRTTFIPTELKPGERIIVDALAGQDYRLDVSVTRHNASPEFEEVCGERGEFRVIREAEANGVIEEDAELAAE